MKLLDDWLLLIRWHIWSLVFICSLQASCHPLQSHFLLSTLSVLRLIFPGDPWPSPNYSLRAARNGRSHNECKYVHIRVLACTRVDTVDRGEEMRRSGGERGRGGPREGVRGDYMCVFWEMDERSKDCTHLSWYSAPIRSNECAGVTSVS